MADYTENGVRTNKSGEGLEARCLARDTGPELGGARRGAPPAPPGLGESPEPPGSHTQTPASSFGDRSGFLVSSCFENKILRTQMTLMRRR